MSKYIDATTFKASILRYAKTLLSHKRLPITKRVAEEVINDVCFAIDIQDSVDVVPVVRCKDCKYASFSVYKGKPYISCENNEDFFHDVPEDGYCYCGEKVKKNG